MQIVVLNGTLTEAEQDEYVKQVTARCPIGLIEKLFLDVQGGIRGCPLHPPPFSSTAEDGRLLYWFA